MNLGNLSGQKLSDITLNAAAHKYRRFNIKKWLGNVSVSRVEYRAKLLEISTGSVPNNI